MRLVDLRCPRCGAGLDYDAESGQATCSYCGAVIQVESDRPAGEPSVDIRDAAALGFDFERGRQQYIAETRQAAYMAQQRKAPVQESKVDQALTSASRKAGRAVATGIFGLLSKIVGD